MTGLRRFHTWLNDPIPILPLVFFRIAFGGIMLWEVWRYFNFDRISRYYIEPSFFFHYFGFEWVKPLPGDGMFLVWHGLGALSVAIMLGAGYRLATTLFWLGFTYIFLLDETQYLNHFYLITLISFLMIIVPTHRAWSVDAWLRPGLRTHSGPRWALWTLRGQMAIVYIYGGIAKLNPDWLQGEPMRPWLAARTDFPFIGHLFTEEWMVYLFSYGGLLFDLFIVPLILWRRTRWLAILLAIGFHLTNARLFSIGIFPWFALAATALFLPPAWFTLWQTQSRPKPPLTWRTPNWVLATLALFFAVQGLMPLRHFVWPSDVSWSEEGHNLAWHMKLRSKKGTTVFFASDRATGTTWTIDLRYYLTPRQQAKIADHPQMILRFAHHLARQLEAQGHEDVAIRAWSMMSLNRRAPQLLLDPTADLVRQVDALGPANWILPLIQGPAGTAEQAALLVSQREPGLLILINITEKPFPLASLSLQAGPHTWDATELSFSQLEPGECLLVQSPSARPDLLPICNEAGQRVTLDDVTGAQWWQASQPVACDGPACVIVAAEPAPASRPPG